jgi:hypothetical protein
MRLPASSTSSTADRLGYHPRNGEPDRFTESTPDHDAFDLDAALRRRSDATGRPTRLARPMSRRHHGGRPHRPNGHARNPLAPMAAAPTEPPRPRPEPFIPGRIAGPPPAEAAAPADQLLTPTAPDAPSTPGLPITHPAPIAYPQRPAEPRSPGPGPGPGPGPDGGNLTASAGCTAPQLRRFIKSRPYVPMHELRRRFGINGQEDDVTPVDLAGGRIFVGLPSREGGLLGELLRGGEVGYELSLDPRSPIVVGLYPMRPVPRS